MERFARRMGRRIESLHPDDARRLQEYHWPGNVRELQNVIERALTAASGKISGANGAAEILGLPASAVSSRMKPLGIQRK